MKTEGLKQEQESENVKIKGPKIPKFVEGDDIEVFLRTFEKLAKVHNWDKQQWAKLPKWYFSFINDLQAGL